MRLQIDKRGVCTISGTELANKPIPPLAVRPKGKGYWQFYWDDLPAFVKSWKHKPETDDLSRSNLRAISAQYRKLLEAMGAPLRDECDVSSHFAEEYAPRAYQLVAGQRIYDLGALLLADSVGMGKSLSSWCAAELMAKQLGTVKVIIVCPSSLKWQWREEIFDYTEDRVKVFVSDGPKAERQEIYKRFLRCRGCAAITINYELLLHDTEELTPVFETSCYVIADEASRIKTRTTQTSKKLKALSRSVRWKAALTATPIEVGVENLYSIIEWLDPQLCATQQLFNGVYCQTATVLFCNVCKKMRYLSKNQRGCPKCGNKELRWVPGKSFTKVTGYQNLDHLARRSYVRVLRRRPQDVGNELPQIVASVRYVDLTKAQRLAYEAAKDGSVRLYAERMPMIETLDSCRACLSPRLCGVPENGIKTKELVEQLTTELADEKVLVFSESKRYLKEEVLPELKKAGIKVKSITGDVPNAKRTQIQREFNADAVQVLVMTSAGERGLNLPCGVVIDLDLPWNPSRILQRAGRARRMGSEYSTVRVFNYVARDTVEERVLERVVGRRSMSEVVVGAEEADVVGLKLTANEVRKLL